MALSRRGQRTLPLIKHIGEYVEPPIYFPSTGRGPPLGDIINLATAENWLLRNELIPKFHEYISDNFTISDLSYVSGFGGAPALLQGLADYFNDHFNIPQVIPDNIVTAPGASHLLESVLYNICDEDAAVLIQTPYWPGFDEALTLRNRLVATHVNVPFDDPDTDFFGKDIVEAYEQALITSPTPVQAMIICNPHNPTGGCYPLETLEALLTFAQLNDLQVVVDELYGKSVFNGTPDTFHSLLSIDLARLRVDSWRVHVVYSFSKDLNSSGIRLGIFITKDNHALRDAIAAQQQSKLSSFTSVAATQFLQDKGFVKNFIDKNPVVLKKNFDVAKSFLDYYKLHFIPPTAGVFIFVKFPNINTVKEEQDLENKFSENGVRINGGTHFHAIIPGYFRLIFAVERETLINGLHRIENTLGWKGWIPPLEGATRSVVGSSTE